MSQFALGLDYGTASVRALIVRCEDGEEVGTAVWAYEHGRDGVIESAANPNFARQHPADCIKGAQITIRGALAEASRTPGFSPELVVGIGVDTTGSTPIPVDQFCQPVAFDPGFAENPAALAWLWKDHTGYAEAAEISLRSNEMGLPYMAMVGGVYSSEWFWSKILHCARTAPDVFEAAHSWIELCDFVPAYLTGVKKPEDAKRGVCSAGHKALYNPGWGGLPSKDFLNALDPRLGALRDRLYDVAEASDQVAGKLDPAIAKELGLPAGITVAVGAFDAHMGAVGSGVRPGTLVKIVGTSTCDIMVAPAPSDGTIPFIPGMCGVVRDSVIPGFLGIEAGQSAVGDLFNWAASHLAPAEFGGADAHAKLSEAALKLKPGESGLLALDWNNGNRTVLVDQRLTGLLIGQTLSTTAPEIYRALIEATAFGALTIIRRMEEYGAKVESVVNCGGISEKSGLVMQIYADVTNRPMKISRSAQTCALGAAIFASVAGGAHSSVLEAQPKMTGVKEVVFTPNPDDAATYARLYECYRNLHDAFGGVSGSAQLGRVMKDLLDIRDSVRQA